MNDPASRYQSNRLGPPSETAPPPSWAPTRPPSYSRQLNSAGAWIWVLMFAALPLVAAMLVLLLMRCCAARRMLTRRRSGSGSDPEGFLTTASLPLTNSSSALPAWVIQSFPTYPYKSPKTLTRASSAKLADGTQPAGPIPFSRRSLDRPPLSSLPRSDTQSDLTPMVDQGAVVSSSTGAGALAPAVELAVLSLGRASPGHASARLSPKRDIAIQSPGRDTTGVGLGTGAGPPIRQASIGTAGAARGDTPSTPQSSGQLSPQFSSPSPAQLSSRLSAETYVPPSGNAPFSGFAQAKDDATAKLSRANSGSLAVTSAAPIAQNVEISVSAAPTPPAVPSTTELTGALPADATVSVARALSSAPSLPSSEKGVSIRIPLLPAFSAPSNFFGFLGDRHGTVNDRERLGPVVPSPSCTEFNEAVHGNENLICNEALNEEERDTLEPGRSVPLLTRETHSPHQPGLQHGRRESDLPRSHSLPPVLSPRRTNTPRGRGGMRDNITINIPGVESMTISLQGRESMTISLQGRDNTGNAPADSSGWMNSFQRLSKRINWLSSFGRSSQNGAGGGNDAQTCMICLDDYVEGDMMMDLPCGHCFHKDCIVAWLKSHDTCPACRMSLMPRQPVQPGVAFD